MTRPSFARDPAEVGRSFTHVLFECASDEPVERVFDFQLDLELRDALSLVRPGHHERLFEVVARELVVIDSPPRTGQPTYTTFVQFIRCEEIVSMPAEDAPLSPPPAKVPATKKERS